LSEGFASSSYRLRFLEWVGRKVADRIADHCDWVTFTAAYMSRNFVEARKRELTEAMC